MKITYFSRSYATDFVFFDLDRNGVLYLATARSSFPDELWTLERLNKRNSQFTMVRKHLNPKAWAEALAATSSHLKGPTT